MTIEEMTYISEAIIFQKPLILFGTGDLAQIARLYFDRDTEYKVVAFTVDREYMKEPIFCGLPVIPWDEIHNYFLPEDHYFHAAIVYNNLNRDRANICNRAEKIGYKLVSYISPYSFIAPTAKIGRHCFIFEDNVIQDFVEIGDRCVLWSSNHAGHSSIIGSDVFVSSHVVISGHCNIGSNTFLGVNSTLANNTTIGKNCWVGHASVISGNVPDNSFVKSPKSEIVPLDEAALNRALERARK